MRPFSLTNCGLLWNFEVVRVVDDLVILINYNRTNELHLSLKQLSFQF